MTETSVAGHCDAVADILALSIFAGVAAMLNLAQVIVRRAWRLIQATDNGLGHGHACGWGPEGRT